MADVTETEGNHSFEGCKITATHAMESHGESRADFDCDSRPRSVSFHEPLTTSIHCIPLRSPEETADLFYNRQDFAAFQADEQRRYDKMMMKRIQQMVQEAMKDELEAAYARNATPEEIEAMMPQTTEEIFSLLGGISALDMPKPPSAVKKEQMYQSTFDVETETVTSSDLDPDERLQKQESDLDEDDNGDSKMAPAKKESPENQLEDISDDALYEIMGIEKDEDKIEPTPGNDSTPEVVDDTLSPNGKEKKYNEELEENTNESPKRQKREIFHRPAQWAEAASDTELYDMLGLTSDEASPTSATDIENNAVSEKREHFHRPTQWAETATDSELYDMFGLASEASETKCASDGSTEEDLNDEIHLKFHIGNDDPSELAMLKEIEKNDAINDVLGTSFSSEVHLEDLVPISPKHSPKVSPVRSPHRWVAVPMVDLDGNS